VENHGTGAKTMMWTIIRNSAADFWDEMLFLIIFNVIWIIGLVLIIPWPLVTFGLFYTVHDIGEAKGIGFGTFWGYARRTWRQAALWGAINAGVLIIAWVNLRIYDRLEAQWAGLAQTLVVAVGLCWSS
jgi:hypothetical protein